MSRSLYILIVMLGVYPCEAQILLLDEDFEEAVHVSEEEDMAAAIVDAATMLSKELSNIDKIADDEVRRVFLRITPLLLPGVSSNIILNELKNKSLGEQRQIIKRVFYTQTLEQLGKMAILYSAQVGQSGTASGWEAKTIGEAREEIAIVRNDITNSEKFFVQVKALHPELDQERWNAVLTPLKKWVDEYEAHVEAVNRTTTSGIFRATEAEYLQEQTNKCDCIKTLIIAHALRSSIAMGNSIEYQRCLSNERTIDNNVKQCKSKVTALPAGYVAIRKQDKRRLGIDEYLAFAKLLQSSQKKEK